MSSLVDDLNLGSVSEPEPAPANAPVRRQYRIGSVDDLPVGGRLAVVIGRREIAVFNVLGKLHAIAGRCPHQNAPLSRGRIQGTVICDESTDWKTEWAHDDEILVCPGHGMEFNLNTGKCLGFSFSLRTYDVEIQGDDILLYL